MNFGEVVSAFSTNLIEKFQIIFNFSMNKLFLGTFHSFSLLRQTFFFSDFFLNLMLILCLFRDNNVFIFNIFITHRVNNEFASSDSTSWTLQLNVLQEIFTRFNQKFWFWTTRKIEKTFNLGEKKKRNLCKND